MDYLVLFIISILTFVIGIFVGKRTVKTNIPINFVDTMAILNYFLEKAYPIIYKNHIFVYSLDGIKLSEERFKDAAKEFIILVLKLIGPNLEQILVSWFGNHETLFLNISEYFNDKYESDEIRSTALDNVINNDSD